MIRNRRIVADDLDQIIEVTDTALSKDSVQDDEDLEDGVLLIHSEIGPQFWESVIRPLKKLERDDDIENIQIFLSTVGGDITEALTYCDIIDRIEKPTVVTLFGDVLSCGFVMACAGHGNTNVRTVCYPSVVAMMHSPFVVRYKDEIVTTKTINELRDVLGLRRNFVFDYIMSHSKITPEIIEEIENKEYYMDAETLLKYGVVDEIL